jgi:hypothetical protein
MLLPSGPDMVRGLYCIGPEARHGLHLMKVSCYGIRAGHTIKNQDVGANLVFTLVAISRDFRRSEKGEHKVRPYIHSKPCSCFHIFSHLEPANPIQ